MKRLRSSFVGFIFAVSVFGLFSYASQETPRAAATDNIWTGSISVSELESVTPTQLINRFDCEYQNSMEVFIPDTSIYAEGATPSFINEELFELGEKCIVKNRQGVFTSQFTQSTYDTFIRSAYYGPNRARMFNVYPQGTQWLDPAPRTDSVFLLSHTALNSTTYTVTEITDYSDGKPEVRQGQLVWPTPTEGSDYWRDKNGQSVKIYNHSFSSNGRYMVIQYDRVVAKVDLYTKELTPFLYQRYATGGEFAISNDGKYVAQLQDGLFIHDTELCENRYSYGSWDVGYKPFMYPGCSATTNLVNPLRASGDLSSMSVIAQYRQPYFTENGSGVILAEGVRNSSGLPGLDGYDWMRHELHADSYVSSAYGYLAMGDSFSSGEGDGKGGVWYEPGTDEQGDKATFEGRNLCHLSRRSYPYLIAKELGYIPNTEDPYTPLPDDPFHSVACSGAKIHNLLGSEDGVLLGEGDENDFKRTDNQFRYETLGELGSWQPGRARQLDYVLGGSEVGSESISRPQLITIGIGGNDAGFGEVILSCSSFGTCQEAIVGSLESNDLIKTIAQLKDRLSELYKEAKLSAPEAKIFTVGYPQFITTDGPCEANTPFNTDERIMIKNNIQYMNSVVKAAAEEAGVNYVDVTNILNGTNLCSGVEKSLSSFNGVTAGNDVDTPWYADLISLGICYFRSGCIGNESFHPNSIGHASYRHKIISATNNLTVDNPTAASTQYPIPDATIYGQVVSEEITGWNNGVKDEVVSSAEILQLNDDGLWVYSRGHMPNSEVIIEAHSTPIVLGSVLADADGVAALAVDLSSLGPGTHSIHAKGLNRYGEKVRSYGRFVVGQAPGDFDGDGVLDTTDTCMVMQNIQTDEDNDGVDDACDDDVEVIDEPPTDPEDPPEDKEDSSDKKPIVIFLKKLIAALLNFFSRLRWF